MSTQYWRSIVAALVAASLVTGTLMAGGVLGQQQADGTAETPDQDTTFLRVAHASPDAPAVDVYLDGDQVLSDVEFGDVSDYMAVGLGEHTVRIATAEENETVIEGNVTLDSRTATTLYAAGEVGNDAERPLDPVLFDDDAYEPSENQSALAVVHLSPDAPTVDVTVGDGEVVLAENVSYSNASDYITVPAGNYTVEVRPATADNDGEVVATTNVSLEGGTAYSALAIGYVDGFDSAIDEAFQIQAVEDATMTIHLPGDEEETETETATDTETPNNTETPTPVTPTEAPVDEETPNETATAGA